MSDKPKRMIFTISDAERAALEAHRIRLGLRSHADTLRALIHASRAPTDAEVNAAASTALRTLKSNLAFPSDIQVGPVTRKPGAMLKAPKK